MLKNFKVMVEMKGKGRVKIIRYDRVTPFLQAAGAVYHAIMGELVLREDLSGTQDIGMSVLSNAVDRLFTGKTGSKLDIPELMHLVKQGSIFYRGREIVFKKEISAIKNEIARAIKDRVKVVWGNKLDFFHTIFMAGGDARQLKGAMDDLYNSIRVVRDGQMDNALGFLKVGAGGEEYFMIIFHDIIFLDATDMLKRFTAAVIKEGNWYVAKCIEVEVTSQGKTVIVPMHNKLAPGTLK
jgi:plasmid segregation protein ParM